MPSPLKVIVPVLGIGGVGAVGSYAILWDSSTIRDRLKQDVKGLARKILDSDSRAEWSEWKKVYKDSSSKIDGVANEDDLPKWCVDTLSQKFDSSKYDSAKLWCVINTSTLRGQAGEKGVVLLSGEGDDSDGKWKNAWDKLNKAKGTAGAISDPTVMGDSVSANTQGGPALKTWCTARYSWGMYKLEARNDFEKVVKWCNEAAGNSDSA